MKKVAIALVLAVVVLAATSSLAQTISLRADVPIAFSIDGRHYAAGPYQLRTIAYNAVELRNAKTGDAGLVKLTYHDQGVGVNNPAPNLKFALNGRRACLMSLTDGWGNTWKVRSSPADLEVSSGSGSKTVIVALK